MHMMIICLCVKSPTSTSLSARYNKKKENAVDSVKEMLLGLLRCCLQNTF